MYTYKKENYISNLTGNELSDEVVDIEAFSKNTNQQNTDINYDIWYDRFTYKRNVKSKLYPDYDINIITFLKDNKIEIKNNYNNTLISLYKEVDKLSYIYADWCIKIKPLFYKKENDYIKLSSFFKGALGEFIWHLYLKLNKKIRISENNIQTEYVFSNICMRDSNDIDLGIDNIGEVEIDGKDKHNCIFQFKFYSPFQSNVMTLKYIQSIHDDGCTNGFIISKDIRVNTFICWFGTDKDVSKWLQRATVLNKCIKFIDINTQEINQSNSIISDIINTINNLKNLE